MYLVKLEIRNFRAIQHMVVDFGMPGNGMAGNRMTANSVAVKKSGTRRWTVLLGENGCGKSTVLKAIGLLLAGSEALPDLLGDTDQWIHNRAKNAELKATIATVKGEERQISLILRRGDGRDMVIRHNEKGLALLDDAIRHADRNYFVAGYGAFRRPGDTEGGALRPTDRGRAGRLGTLFSPAHQLVGLESWIIGRDYVSGQQGRTLIAQVLDKLLPGMRFKDIDKESRAVIMETVDGDVPLRQLSEGYQAMAAWAGDLLYRITETFGDRKDPLSARGVLLIDEMDLHLHPVWKRRLVAFLDDAFPHLQVVATTHSPLAVQQCGEGELFVVRREGEVGQPELVAFRGDPGKLRLSELFLSPLIGLDTLDSPRVAAWREEARQIELRSGRKSATDLKRLATIRSHLEGTTPLPVDEAPAFAELIAFQQRMSRTTTVDRIRGAEALFGAAGRAVAVPASKATRAKAETRGVAARKRVTAATAPTKAASNLLVATASRSKPAAPQKAAAKKVAAKKVAAKKVAAKKVAAKKVAAKKVAAKKVAAKKVAAKRAPA
ncbi:Putative ATP-binding protein involved in virulence [Cupriavidus sp. H19C3]